MVFMLCDMSFMTADPAGVESKALTVVQRACMASLVALLAA
jgi:hypothetical protein